MAKKEKTASKQDTNANLGLEDKMWQLISLLRDTLLPKLISGQFRVRDSERFVEAVM